MRAIYAHQFIFLYLIRIAASRTLKPQSIDRNCLRAIHNGIIKMYALLLGETYKWNIYMRMHTQVRPRQKWFPQNLAFKCENVLAMILPENHKRILCAIYKCDTHNSKAVFHVWYIFVELFWRLWFYCRIIMCKSR